MELLIIWLFFGLFSALIAMSMKRSVIGWFLIGIILGPLGLLFAFFMKGKEIKNQKNILNVVPRDNIEKTPQKKETEFCDETYHYEIQAKDGIPSVDQWHRIKELIFTHFNDDYKIKQNDGETFIIEFEKTSYIKMTKIKKADEKGSIKLFFHIDSVKCVDLDFGDEFEASIVQRDKEEPIIDHEVKEHQSSDDETPSDSTDKLIKLSELLEKGLITEEEFLSQKKKILT